MMLNPKCWFLYGNVATNRLQVSLNFRNFSHLSKTVVIQVTISMEGSKSYLTDVMMVIGMVTAEIMAEMLFGLMPITSYYISRPNILYGFNIPKMTGASIDDSTCYGLELNCELVLKKFRE